MLTVFAHAKINLTLEVINKRQDGYHEIASVLQTISLSDELSFEETDAIEFACNDPSIGKVDLLEAKRWANVVSSFLDAMERD